MRDASFRRRDGASVNGEDGEEDERAPLRRGHADVGAAQSGVQSHHAGGVRRELAEQDAVLDALHSSVSRLGVISEKIHEEIVVQDRMLDDLEDSVERVDASVNDATARARGLLRQNGSWCCILGVVAAILLIFIVFLLVF